MRLVGERDGLVSKFIAFPGLGVQLLEHAIHAYRALIAFGTNAQALLEHPSKLSLRQSRNGGRIRHRAAFTGGEHVQRRAQGIVWLQRRLEIVVQMLGCALAPGVKVLVRYQGQLLGQAAVMLPQIDHLIDQFSGRSGPQGAQTRWRQAHGVNPDVALDVPVGPVVARSPKPDARQAAPRGALRVFAHEARVGQKDLDRHPGFGQPAHDLTALVVVAMDECKDMPSQSCWRWLDHQRRCAVIASDRFW